MPSKQRISCCLRAQRIVIVLLLTLATTAAIMSMFLPVLKSTMSGYPTYYLWYVDTSVTSPGESPHNSFSSLNCPLMRTLFLIIEICTVLSVCFNGVGFVMALIHVFHAPQYGYCFAINFFALFGFLAMEIAGGLVFYVLYYSTCENSVSFSSLITQSYNPASGLDLMITSCSASFLAFFFESFI